MQYPLGERNIISTVYSIVVCMLLSYLLIPVDCP